jgi:hypothetical protein
MTEPIDALGVVEALSGVDIVEDIAQRVVAAPTPSCHLRQSDQYASYSARVAEIGCLRKWRRDVPRRTAVGACA